MVAVKPVRIASAAANRVKASKQRQRSKIDKPTPISDALGNIINSKSQAAFDKNLPTFHKAPKPTAPYGGQTANYQAAQASVDANNAAPVSGSDDLGTLQAALAAQLAGGTSGMSDKEISKLLNQSVNGTYDPQIAAIQHEMGYAKKRAKTARADLKALYADLSGYYDNRAGATGKMYGIAEKGAQTRTNSVKNSITSDYTNRLKEQVDMYKQLGIEAAAPSATQGQYADEAGQLATADNTGNAEQAALAQESQGDQTYWNEGAGIAQMEGTEQQTGVINQLTDYLNTEGSSLAGLKGQKSAAYSQALLEAKQKRADQANQQQNQIWQHMVDLAKLKQSAAKASSTSAGKTPVKGLAGVASYLPSQRLADEFQTSLQQATTWSQSPQATQYYGGKTPNTPEEMAQVIRDNAANRGLSPSDQLALWQAALVYYNKYT